MSNILVVYCATVFPLRTTIADHLYSFDRYSKHQCFYFNAALRAVPSYFKEVQFDLIIFHTIFLSARWGQGYFRSLMKKVQGLKSLSGIRIALPQDEFLNTDILAEFIHEFDVRHIFSVMPADQWLSVYPTVDGDKTKIHSVLTGYLDEGTIERIEQLSQLIPTIRPIDIGYRAWHAAYWLGRHGRLKVQVAERFQAQAAQWGLTTDISTLERDTLLGDQWLQHLLSCRYTIGSEGGASILDHDGTVRRCTEAYLAEHPDASFEEVEANCFPGLDGKVNLVAISPRHLEACATRTCQILVEGSYSGILEPGRHYIPLKKDFSNLDEVMGLIRNDMLRAQIVEQAYQDIVQSNHYTTHSFVERVLRESMPKKCTEPTPAEQMYLLRNRREERAINGFRAIRSGLVKAIEKLFSTERVARWKQMYYQLRSY